MTNNNPLISIIVPVYNAEKYLTRCIDSIINQTYKNLEVLLIDDGSIDGIGLLCNEYGDRDSRIKVIHKKNGGQASARNCGLDIAIGAYIGFVDSDDWVQPDMYEKMIGSMLNHDLVVCGRFNVSESTGKMKTLFSDHAPFETDTKKAVTQFLLTDNLDGSPCDKLFKKSLIGDMRFPLGYICEDLPFVCSYLLRCKSIYHVSEPLYYYLQRQGSTSHSSFSERTMGLIIYPDSMRKNVLEVYPELIKETDVYCTTRKLSFLKTYYDSKTKEKLPVEYHIRDFKCLDKKSRLIIFLMKIHLYRFVSKIWRHFNEKDY